MILPLISSAFPSTQARSSSVAASLVTDAIRGTPGLQVFARGRTSPRPNLTRGGNLRQSSRRPSVYRAGRARGAPSPTCIPNPHTSVRSPREDRLGGLAGEASAATTGVAGDHGEGMDQVFLASPLAE